MADPILIAKGEVDLYLLPQMANRHGLIAGATGAGKTISLQVLAEGLSHIGVSVFLADVRSLRDEPTGQGQSESPGTRATLEAQGLCLPGLPCHILGRIWRPGTSHSRNRLGNGAVITGPPV